MFNSPANLPAVNWLTAHPLLAIGFTAVTGFIDGINPCAITTLLLFIGGLLVIAERAVTNGDIAQARRRTWIIAGSFILGNFLLYLVLGAGFVEVSSLRIFGNAHLFTRLSGLVAVFVGLAMIIEYIAPTSPLKITMPATFQGIARKWGRQTTTGAAFISGILIGSCTIPCGGAMYLVVASLFGQIPNKAYAYGLLLLYNILFVLPLVLLVALSSNRRVLTQISRIHIAHRGRVKLVLGCFVILVGLLTLW